MHLTIHSRRDGFGAQYQAHIAGIALAKHLNMRYINTPYDSLGHNINGKIMDEFTNLKLKYDSIQNNGIQNNRIININNLDEIDNYKINDTNDNIIISMRNCHLPYLDSNVDLYDNIIDDIRECYFSTPKQSYIIENKINVAVHIRGGDIITNDKYRHRCINDDKYLKLINELRNKYDNIVFHIFSESTNNNLFAHIRDFTKYKADDIILHMDSDIKMSFHSMVMADILIMSKSSFSYTAGLLNKGIVYYFPFWHAPLKRWNIV